MANVSVEEARRDLASLMSRAQAGEEIVITHDGRAVVKLVAVASTSPELPDMSEFHKRIKLKEGSKDPNEVLLGMREEHR
jgi:prevent-host-death family protein